MRAEVLDYIIENAVNGECELPADYFTELIEAHVKDVEYDFMPQPPRRMVQDAKIGFFSHAPAIYEYEYDDPIYKKRLLEWEARQQERRQIKDEHLSVITPVGTVKIKLKKGSTDE